MRRVRFRDFINESYVDAFKSAKRELIMYGGAGAGKSYSAGFKLLLYTLTQKDKRMLVLRKTFPSLKLTSLEIIKTVWGMVGVPYRLNKSDYVMETVNNNTIIFKSLDDVEKIKSLTDIELIWIEEPTEIKEDDYEIVKMRLRGRPLKGGEYRQIILTFNPIDRNSWLHKRFWEGGRDYNKVDVFKYTYKDNKFIDEEYGRELEELKNKDEVLYRVYCLGEWGVLKNLIYTNYVIEDIDKPLDWFDEIIGGVDFGYNNPSVFVLTGLKDEEPYYLDEIYRRHLLNSQLIELIKAKLNEWGVDEGIPIYADNEPDRIAEMIEAGLNVYPADKKSVVERIRFMRQRRQHFNKLCVNGIKEVEGYRYKEDKNGNVLEEPVKFNDHFMDASSYGVYTHLKDRGVIGGLL